MSNILGGLAQLARAPALHAGGQRFESVILHFLTIGLECLNKKFFQTNGVGPVGVPEGSDP